VLSGPPGRLWPCRQVPLAAGPGQEHCDVPRSVAVLRVGQVTEMIERKPVEREWDDLFASAVWQRFYEQLESEARRQASTWLSSMNQ